MADVKIIDLPEASSISDTDDIIVEQADGTKKAAVSLLPAGVPDGGTQGQVLTKQSALDGDADWETAGMWHGDEVGSLPVPINADQLEGHPASYFQPMMSGSYGVSVSNNTVSLGQFGSETLPSANKTNCSGTIYIYSLGPLVMIEFNTAVTCTTGGSVWTTLFTLPSDYTPIAKQKFAVIDDSTASSSTGIAGTVEAQVTTNGEFQVWTPVTGHKYWGGVLLYIRS